MASALLLMSAAPVTHSATLTDPRGKAPFEKNGNSVTIPWRLSGDLKFSSDRQGDTSQSSHNEFI